MTKKIKKNKKTEQKFSLSVAGRPSSHSPSVISLLSEESYSAHS